jgi:hypothetical protein
MSQARQTKEKAMTKRSSHRSTTTPAIETLEPRLLLSDTAGTQTLELFSVSPALFVEN